MATMEAAEMLMCLQSPVLKVTPPTEVQLKQISDHRRTVGRILETVCPHIEGASPEVLGRAKERLGDYDDQFCLAHTPVYTATMVLSDVLISTSAGLRQMMTVSNLIRRYYLNNNNQSSSPASTSAAARKKKATTFKPGFITKTPKLEDPVQRCRDMIIRFSKMFDDCPVEVIIKALELARFASHDRVSFRAGTSLPGACLWYAAKLCHGCKHPSLTEIALASKVTSPAICQTAKVLASLNLSLFAVNL